MSRALSTAADRVAMPIGAVLEGCDGVEAARKGLAFHGRWQFARQRATQGGPLSDDAHNPFITRPARCTFRVGGKRQDMTLAWRPLSNAEFDTCFATTASRARPAIGARVLADGTRCYSMSGFNGDPEGATAKALRPIIAETIVDGIATARACVEPLWRDASDSAARACVMAS